jgi:hypothetical protein
MNKQRRDGKRKLLYINYVLGFPLQTLFEIFPILWRIKQGIYHINVLISSCRATFTVLCEEDKPDDGQYVRPKHVVLYFIAML